MKNKYLIIKNWLLRTDLELQKKWWHRLLKIIFVVAIFIEIASFVVYLGNSYSVVVNQWRIVDNISSRLGSTFPSGLHSIGDLYADDEIIAEGAIYERDYFPSLGDKDNLLPFSPIFLKGSESFCSNELDKEIKTIASDKNIKFFSTTNPNLQNLSTDINQFALYLRDSIKCVMTDSYTVTNDDESYSIYNFLRPVDTSDYFIYKYTNNFWEFVLLSVLCMGAVLLSMLVAIFIYHKIILYIIYGDKKSNVVETTTE